jgi:hypothetical protein
MSCEEPRLFATALHLTPWVFRFSDDTIMTQIRLLSRTAGASGSRTTHMRVGDAARFGLRQGLV